MARYTGPVCRLCRRERTKLFLKGERCYSLKCPVSEAVTDRHSRAYPPGEHGRDRMRQGSEYLTQLREKQKARRIYGLLEKQFRNLYEESSRQPGVTREDLGGAPPGARPASPPATATCRSTAARPTSRATGSARATRSRSRKPPGPTSRCGATWTRWSGPPRPGSRPATPGSAWPC